MAVRRTDMAVEARELWSEQGENAGVPDGVRETVRERNGFRVTDVAVLNEKGSQILCKPIGAYVTVELGRLLHREESAFRDGARALADEIREMLRLKAGDAVLVVGLGNPAITPDAVGHLTIKNTLVTRHLISSMPAEFSGFRSVAALEPGVLGTTGLESADVVRAVAEKMRPAAVIAVDALASRRMSRVCRTVQLTDTGIIPGSGVGNGRAALNAQTLGVPVIAVGVPTVVDAATLCADMAEETGGHVDENALREHEGTMIVTPKDIDATVADISRLVGYAVNLALHDGLTVEDVDMFLG